MSHFKQKTVYFIIELILYWLIDYCLAPSESVFQLNSGREVDQYLKINQKWERNKLTGAQILTATGRIQDFKIGGGRT